MSTAAANNRTTTERSRSKTSTATIIKMTDWSPIREPTAVATAAVVRTERTIERPTSQQQQQPPPLPPFVINNLDEARQLITKLTERNKAQGHLLHAWKQRLKQQSELLVGLHREREEQMRLLTSQLLLLEANLRSKQGKIDGLLNQRDRIISNQQETICSLEKELDRCRSCVASSADQQQPPVLAHAIRPQSLPLATTPIQHNMKNNRQQQQQETNKTNKTNATTVLLVVDDKTESVSSDRNQPQQVRVLGREQGDESLDDSDSAVVIDDDHRHSPTFAENPQVRVIRSISDVVDSSRMEIFREKQPGILKSTKLVKNHQRRVMFLQPEEPEVEEEEEEDGIEDNEDEEEEEEEEEEEGSAGSSSSDDSPFNKRGHKTFLRGSFERMPVHQDSSRGSGLSSSSLRAATHCSNHRSVTRPRDVKFKKNNKGSSSSSSSSSWMKPAIDGCSRASGNQEFQTSFSHAV